MSQAESNTDAARTANSIKRIIMARVILPGVSKPLLSIPTNPDYPLTLMSKVLLAAKVIGGLSVAFVLFTIVVANFGTVETGMECPGDIVRTSDNSVLSPATLHAQVQTYRRWILFWFRHDAMITWDIQPRGTIGFGYYSASPFAASIWNLESTEQYGSWSSLSRRIHIALPSAGTAFVGTCG